MATAGQIAAWAAGAEARGVIPRRPVGPPDWQARGAVLSFMLTQGYSNEHAGDLPPSDAAFIEWAAAPYVNDRNLRRYWPPGSVDVKTDGSRNAPPWDWQPMGCPGGQGCNDEDWMNHAPWPAPSPGGSGGVAVLPSSAGGGVAGGVGGGLGAGVSIPGLGSVSPTVLMAAGAGLLIVLLARRR